MVVEQVFICCIISCYHSMVPIVGHKRLRDGWIPAIYYYKNTISTREKWQIKKRYTMEKSQWRKRKHINEILVNNHKNIIENQPLITVRLLLYYYRLVIHILLWVSCRLLVVLHFLQLIFNHLSFTSNKRLSYGYGHC